MRKMNKVERKEIESTILRLMASVTSSEYARDILNSELREEYEDVGRTFMDAVIDDVLDCSAWEDDGYYNDDDVRLAIGRVFMDRLGIFY